MLLVVAVVEGCQILAMALIPLYRRDVEEWSIVENRGFRVAP
jgi:hypothetical protein